MNKNPFRWGIIGLGRIAHKFAEVVAVVEDGVLYAVAGRNIERAEAFAKKFNAPKSAQHPRLIVGSTLVRQVSYSIHFHIHPLLCCTNFCAFRPF